MRRRTPAASAGRPTGPGRRRPGPPRPAGRDCASCSTSAAGGPALMLASAAIPAGSSASSSRKRSAAAGDDSASARCTSFHSHTRVKPGPTAARLWCRTRRASNASATATPRASSCLERSEKSRAHSTIPVEAMTQPHAASLPWPVEVARPSARAGSRRRLLRTEKGDSQLLGGVVGPIGSSVPQLG